MARGPTITYVTDGALDDARQREVLRALINAAEDHTLRIAIRLPLASDAVVTDLLDWYMNEADGKPLLPALVHNRPGIASEYPGVRSWLPSRLLHAEANANVWSVHSIDEALQARSLGAEEVIFGHVFETTSHPGEPGRGIGQLRRIAMIPGITVTAIGGINEQSIGAITVDSVACIRAISESTNIANTLTTMSRTWKGK